MFGLEKLAELFKTIKPPGMNAESAGVKAEPAPNLNITPKPPLPMPAAPAPVGMPNPLAGLSSMEKAPSMEPPMQPSQDARPLPFNDVRQEAAFRSKFGNPDYMNVRQYDDPIKQEKFNDVYGRPMAEGKTIEQIDRPGFKGRMAQGGKAALYGLATGGIPGAIGGFLGGAIDPERSQEALWELGRGEQMRGEQAYENDQNNKLAQLQKIFAGIRNAARKTDIDEREVKVKEGQLQQPEWMSPVSVQYDGQPILLQTNRKGGESRMLGMDATITNQNERAAAEQQMREKIANITQTGQNTRNDKQIQSRENIAQGNQAISLYKYDNPNKSANDEDVKRHKEADRWFTALQNAYSAGASKDSDEVEKAMSELRKYPDLYETGTGEGSFPYAKPRQQAQSQAQPKGEVDVESYVKAVEAKGGTREQALQYLRGQGYIR